MKDIKVVIVEEVSNLPVAVDLGNGMSAIRTTNASGEAADAAIGLPSDPKNSNTGATPATVIGILKQLSYQLQFPPQRKIIRTFKATVTLPANQNAYAPGDVILGTSVTALCWDMSAETIKTSATIMGIRVQTTEATTLASKTLRFHIFNDSITPIADNAAFAIADINEGKREGNIQLTMGSGVMTKVGQANYENIDINPVGGKIYFILEDVNGHTPSANSTVINCYIKVELGN